MDIMHMHVRRQTATLASAGQEAPVFLHRRALNKTVRGGANQANQMPYEKFSPDVREISTIRKIFGVLHAYFFSFIVTGDPNAFRGDTRIGPCGRHPMH